MAATPHRSAHLGPGARKARLRAAAGMVLCVAGMAVSTLLLTWGLFVLGLVALGGFSFDGLMHQLANLTSRYVAAEPARTAAFRHLVFAAHLILSGAVVVLRRKALFASLTAKGDTHG